MRARECSSSFSCSDSASSSISPPAPLPSWNVFCASAFWSSASASAASISASPRIGAVRGESDAVELARVSESPTIVGALRGRLPLPGGSDVGDSRGAGARVFCLAMDSSEMPGILWPSTGLPVPLGIQPLRRSQKQACDATVAAAWGTTVRTLHAKRILPVTLGTGLARTGTNTGTPPKEFYNRGPSHNTGHGTGAHWHAKRKPIVRGGLRAAFSRGLEIHKGSRRISRKNSSAVWIHIVQPNPCFEPYSEKNINDDFFSLNSCNINAQAPPSPSLGTHGEVGISAAAHGAVLRLRRRFKHRAAPHRSLRLPGPPPALIVPAPHRSSEEPQQLLRDLQVAVQKCPLRDSLVRRRR